MQAQTTANSKAMLWTGRVISILVTLNLLMSGAFGLMKPAVAVQGSLALGFPESTLVPTGAILVICTILYAIPRTTVLGAILVTGYLGGAVAAHVRIDSGAFDTVFPVILGAMVWGGLYLRDPRLRSFLPLAR
ncbi:MAG TPA: DoxX family protein [Gammaproteobacteria bacterium]|nr:DoxX family protein [Gammaproteobacteria bacterium]